MHFMLLFGRTEVSAYIASKHGITGLLRGVQKSPPHTEHRSELLPPLHSDSNYFKIAGEGKSARLDTPKMVGNEIVSRASEEDKSGSCLVVSLAEISLLGGILFLANCN